MSLFKKKSTSAYQEKHTIEERKAESARIREKYPNRIPIIVEREVSSDISAIDKNKYLVPNDLTIGQFVYVIRKRITVSPDKAIFLFINNTLPATSDLINQSYKEHVHEDGFLYVQYSGESTFGQ